MSLPRELMLTNQLAAKDREIAALREALKEARFCCYPHTRYKIDAALSASPAPDPAEAMRAKCEAIARNPREHYPDKESLSFAEGYRYAIGSIAREIAALKGNGEGL